MQRNDPKAHRALNHLAKALFSSLLLGLVLWKVPVQTAWHHLRDLSLTALISIVFLSFAFPAVAAMRWRRVLHHLDAPSTWSPLLLDHLVASTYNMLLPTSIGGDVVRAWRCGRRIDNPAHAWSTVLFERLVGIIALALLSVPGLMMAPGAMRTLGWVVAAVVAGAVTILLVAPAPLRWAGKLLASRAPAVAGLGDNIATDLSGPLSRLAPRLETMLWSLLYQAVGLGILLVVAVDWGQSEALGAIVGGVPLALILTMIPISIAGLGVRESLFVVLLGKFGLESSQSLSLALIWLASSLLLALSGAVVIAIEGGGKKRK